ncbi:MAG TPA: Fe-S cluster assembly protein SufD [Candidatus Angelobacter sp.]|nr:Fe-S cluster assembly protein SufD [Candidatus Angelobacter sp.]
MPRLYGEGKDHVKKSAIIEAVAEGLTKPAVPLGYSTEFGDFSQRLSDQPAWLVALRREGYTQFGETGFPTTHDEDWRFTNVSAVAQTRFALPHGGAQPPSAADLDPLGVSQFACCLVFINGKFSQKFSRIPALPKGVKITSLAEAITAHPASVEGYLGRYLAFYRDAFAALNTAFIEDGAYVYVPRSTVVEQPIYVLYVSTPEANPTMNHPRNLFIVEENSQATFVEDYVSLPGCEKAALSNTVTELVAGESAVVSHYMIVRESEQTYNFSTLRIQQARSSNVASHSLLLSGALVRNNVHPVLAGEGAECLINGLFMANGRQHMDNYMLVEHASPHCGSRQFYNGILNGQAHGVFHGRIIVHKDAQKTDAKQTNRNLLLCDDAQIDTKPQLEIYADDVKCTHGATIGQVDENALFYLRSRGVDEVAAKHLLLQAFANECLDRMHPGQVRDHVEQLVARWLPETAKFVGERAALAHGEAGQAERAFEEVG